TISLGGGVDVTVNAGDTLATIAQNVNNAANVPVYASVVNNQLVFNAKNTGLANAVPVSVAGPLGAELGMARTITAQDAKWSIDGTPQTDSASNVIANAMPGVQLTLTAQTTGT